MEPTRTNTLFDDFTKNISKHIFGKKTIDVHGCRGSCNLFMSDKGFYDLDQFDIKSLIESIFDCLTPIQQENLVKQLDERKRCVC